MEGEEKARAEQGEGGGQKIIEEVKMDEGEKEQTAKLG